MRLLADTAGMSRREKMIVIDQLAAEVEEATPRAFTNSIILGKCSAIRNIATEVMTELPSVDNSQ